MKTEDSSCQMVNFVEHYFALRWRVLVLHKSLAFSDWYLLLLISVASQILCIELMMEDHEVNG